MVYVINAILNGKSVDIPFVIYHMMLKTTSADRATGSIPFLILIMKIMTMEKVPFKAGATSCHRIPSIAMGYFSKMGLIAMKGEKSKRTF